MKSKVVIQLCWFLAATIVSGIIAYIVFGDGIFNGEPVDIQLHDTYFVFSKSNALIIMSIVVFTSTYFIKWIYFKVNDIMIIVILMFMIAFVSGGLIIYLNNLVGFREQFDDTLYYLGNKNNAVQPEVDFIFGVIKKLTWAYISIAALIVAILGYKILKLYRKKS
jgi:heme/copper-type cytochrome/quinol oxidase subunit 1